jgi:acyl-CoA thioesterase
MTEFDEGTAVTRVAEDTFAANVSTDWWVFTGANGGYLASVLLRALTERVGDPLRMARSLTVHYLRPPASGAATITTRLVRAGRSVATVTATMVQNDAEVALATAVFAYPRPSVAFHDAVMPAVTPVDETPPPAWPRESFPPISQRFEYRPVRSQAIFAGEDRAEVGTWLRLREPRRLDPVLLATIADAAVPAIFPKATAPVAATTIDLTVHFRSAADTDPGDGWCLGMFASTVAVDGFVEEDGEIWSPDGRLLAHSRQLAIVVPVG